MVEILDDIKADDQRASDIIDRIRNLVRKTEFEVRSLDLNEAIDKIMKVLAGEASNRGVFVKAELEPGLSKVSADSVQLQQVILNLALNGMEAMQDLPADKRFLTIRSQRANDRQAEVSVADSGGGIAEESIGTIFDPFVTTKPGGMGMGSRFTHNHRSAPRSDTCRKLARGRCRVLFHIAVRPGLSPVTACNWTDRGECPNPARIAQLHFGLIYGVRGCVSFYCVCDPSMSAALAQHIAKE